MKVSELSGALLDYWVGRSNTEWLPGGDTLRTFNNVFDELIVKIGSEEHGWLFWNPSSNWQQAGPIIDRERIATWHGANGWRAIHPAAMPSGYSGNDYFIDITEGDGEFSGESLLVAAMRAYVASKFGDEVQVEGSTQ